MDKKKTTIAIITVLLVMVISFPGFFFLKEDSLEEFDEGIVGGQVDENGCLGPAGYSWDEELGVCLRSWEISDSGDRKAINEVINLIGSFYGLTVVGVEEIGCPDCRMVFLERDSVRVGMYVKGHKVDDRIISPLECVQRDGVVRNQSYSICEPGEYVVGAVRDDQDIKYCCHLRDLVNEIDD